VKRLGYVDPFVTDASGQTALELITDPPKGSGLEWSFDNSGRDPALASLLGDSMGNDVVDALFQRRRGESYDKSLLDSKLLSISEKQAMLQRSEIAVLITYIGYFMAYCVLVNVLRVLVEQSGIAALIHGVIQCWLSYCDRCRQARRDREAEAALQKRQQQKQQQKEEKQQRRRQRELQEQQQWEHQQRKDRQERQLPLLLTSSPVHLPTSPPAPPTPPPATPFLAPLIPAPKRGRTKKQLKFQAVQQQRARKQLERQQRMVRRK
jgi:hypothetical protein